MLKAFALCFVLARPLCAAEGYAPASGVDNGYGANVVSLMDCFHLVNRHAESV
jgi:hypothetical protein